MAVPSIDHRRSRQLDGGEVVIVTGKRKTAGRRLVGLAEAAEYADVSTRTLRRYIAQGRPVAYRIGPRLVKVDLNEVDELARPIPTARGPG